MVWRLNWRRLLFYWEELLEGELKEIIEKVLISHKRTDSWVSKGCNKEVYSFKKSFKLLIKSCSSATCFGFKDIWIKEVSRKVCTFILRLLQNKIPT